MIRIWTDGCCSWEYRGGGGPGGWAFIAWRAGAGVVERQSGGVPFADAGRMELLAVLEALRWAEGTAEVEVFTDSHYVAHGFNKQLHGWRHSHWRDRRRRYRPIRDYDLWEALWHLTRNAPAKVSQIRRAIHVYNVEADQAAKAAMRRLSGPATRAEQKLMHALDNSLRGVPAAASG
ncbi:MAG TPA: RNase H family protein [Solirubrobacterales bacterium]|nr:RNase H family protein [Solirubrobacterales bacterium]